MSNFHNRKRWILATAVCLVGGWITGDQLSAQDEKNLGVGIILAPKAFRAAASKVLKSVVTIDSFGGVGSVQGAHWRYSSPGRRKHIWSDCLRGRVHHYQFFQFHSKTPNHYADHLRW